MVSRFEDPTEDDNLQPYKTQKDIMTSNVYLAHHKNGVNYDDVVNFLIFFSIYATKKNFVELKVEK